MRIVVPSAAALVLLGTGALVLLTTTPTITLADVIKATEKHKLVKFTWTETVDTKDGESMTHPEPKVFYAELKSSRSRNEHRFLTLNGAVEHVSIGINDGKGRSLSIFSETVVPGEESSPRLKGLTFPRKEATLTRADPKEKPIVDRLRELEQRKGVVVTNEKLGGREAVKYYLEDGTETTQLWIDRDTKLPLRVEWEKLDLSPDITRIKWVFADFEWDPKLPKGFKDLDALFDTTRPEGYKLDDQTKNEKK